MHEFLSRECAGKDLETDFKHAGVWMGDNIIVTWDVDEGKFMWDNEVAMSNGVDSDMKSNAEKYTEKK